LSSLVAVAAFAAAGVLIASAAGAPGATRYVDHYSPAVSRDGRTIAYVDQISVQARGSQPRAVQSRIVLVNADGSHRRVLLHRGVRFERDPTFSPDGRQIAFTRGDRVFLMQRDGLGVRPLKRDVLSQSCARYAPGGRRLSLWRGRYGKSGAYYIVDADGGGLRRLVGGIPVPQGCAAWSPNGQELAFARNGKIFLIRADGAGLKQVRPAGSAADTYFYRPAFAPDGTLLALDGEGPTGNGIHVLKLDGRGLRRLTSSPNELSPDTGPQWLPDGRTIVYSGTRGPSGRGARIYRIPLNGRRLVRLT
jgi:Tol biopolymer transport system component